MVWECDASWKAALKKNQAVKDTNPFAKKDLTLYSLDFLLLKDTLCNRFLEMMKDITIEHYLTVSTDIGKDKKTGNYHEDMLSKRGVNRGLGVHDLLLQTGKHAPVPWRLA